jgi:hypothetical protein
VPCHSYDRFIAASRQSFLRTAQVEKRLVEMRFALTGRIPDGMLFRVSSIDIDAKRAFEAQDAFIRDLLAAVPPEGRQRLSGLSAKTGTDPVSLN